MMIVEPPLYPKKITEITKKGCQLFGFESVPLSESESSLAVGHIAGLLHNIPYPSGRPEAELVKGQYLTAIGIVYAKIIANAFGWKLCGLRTPNSRKKDAVDAVISPDQSYFVFPIAVVYKEAHRHSDECRKVYEKIKTGNLPDVPAGSFFEITA